MVLQGTDRETKSTKYTIESSGVVHKPRTGHCKKICAETKLAVHGHCTEESLSHIEG